MMCYIRGLLLSLATVVPAFSQTIDNLSEGVRAYVDVPESVVAITHATVIDGTGAPAARDMTVVVQDGVITAYGKTSAVNVPDGARVINASDDTVMPGMVGLHNHTYYTTSRRSAQLNYSAPRLYLASGVTTIRTTGSRAPYSEINLKAGIDNGDIPGPRLFVTGPYITGGEGMTTMTKVSSPEDARRVVEYWANEGVQWFKAYTQIGHDELAAAIDEAHKHGVKVTGHLCSVSFREAVAMGIDNLEHGFFTNTDYYEGKEKSVCPPDFRSKLIDVDLDGPEVKATFDDMISNGVPMTSTLAVYEMFVPGRPPLDERVLAAMSDEVKADFLERRAQVAKQRDNPDYPFTEALFDKALAYEYKFYKAGGLLASGVDPTGYGGALPGYGDQRNYELLREAGFTPEECVQILSLNGARVLGIDDELGSIAVGKKADLVVLRGDLRANDQNIQKVQWVFKDGVGFSAQKLIDAVRGEVGVR
ncbi:MAG: amidohydrolase family protein [Bacteroidetes bacterium]|nr:amidohydrolase family protein [Bacteroidota bacterium]